MFKKVSMIKFESWIPFPTSGFDKPSLLTPPVKIGKPVKDMFLSKVRPNGVNPQAQKSFWKK